MVVKAKCEWLGCDREAVRGDRAQAIERLKVHDTQAHSIANKPEKPRRPTLIMPGDAVEDKDWDHFIFQFKTYKKLAGIDTDSYSHLIQCLSPEVHKVLFSTYGEEIMSMTEAHLTDNINRLVV